MANRNWLSGGKIYSMHANPVLLDCNFIVAPTATTGLGITTLKGPGIQNVFMNSTATFAGDTHTNTVIDGISSTAALSVGMRISGSGITPGTKIATITSATAITTTLATTATASGVTITYGGIGNSNNATPNIVVASPNPAASNIVVQFQDNYVRSFFSHFNMRSPLSGSSLTSTTFGVAYEITILGTATAAQWLAAGVPAGITPALGVSFIAAATGTIGGSAAVQIAASTGSAVAQMERIGSSTLMLAPIPGSAQGFGGELIFQCRDYAGALVAPVAGTTVHLGFYMSNSSVVVQGE